MVIVIPWIVISIIAGLIAINKGRSWVGFFFLSLFLSPIIGIIAVLLAKPSPKKMRAKSNVSGLIKALKSGSGNIREEAYGALIGVQRMGRPEEKNIIFSPRSVGLLIDALEDKDDIVRVTAAKVLGKIGDRRAIEPLNRRLTDNVSFVRGWAAISLGKMGDRRAIEPLFSVLADQTPIQFQIHYLAAGGDLSIRGGGPAHCARESEESLFNLNVPFERLMKAFKDTNKDVRAYAVSGLAKHGGSRVVSLLISALKDKDDDVRLRAASELGKFKDKRAVAPLIVALEDENPSVVIDASQSLGMLGDQRAVRPLMNVLLRWEPSWGSMDPICEALLKIKDDSEVRDIVKRAEERLEEARWALRKEYEERMDG